MGFLQYINFTLILVHLPNQVSLLKRLLQRKTLCHQTQTKPQIFTRYFGGSCQRTLQVKLSNTCSIIIANNLSHVYKEDDDHELNHTDIYFDESLSFTISIYANLISSQHKIYSVYEKSVKYVTLTNLIKHLLAFNSCSGVTNENAKKCAVSHSIPKKFNPNQIFNNPTMFYLSSDCLISCQAENCIKCKKKSSKRKKVNYSSQAKCPHFTNI